MTFKTIQTPLIALGIVGTLFLFVYLGGSSVLPSITGAPRLDTTEAPPSASLIGQQSPYFDLPDISGTHVKLTQFSTTPIIVVFWSTWNSQAADQIQILDQYIAHKSPEAQLAPVVAINSQEEKSLVSSFVSRGGYQVQVVLDTQGIATSQYQIKSLPTFFFIDSTGIVRDVHAGVLSEKELMDRVDRVLQ